MALSDSTIPTLYVWAGGTEAIQRLVSCFYDFALKDDLLGPVFEHMAPDHVQLVGLWLIEVFGGPKDFSQQHKLLEAAPDMIRKHRGLRITEAQRARWVQLMLKAADTVELPDDPEFRSAFMAYIEWGTRMAKAFSNGMRIPKTATVPTWGWGEAPPYIAQG